METPREGKIGGASASVVLAPAKVAAELISAAKKMKKIFRFQELPPELRNHVYGLVLVAERPIEISRHVNVRNRAAKSSFFYRDCMECRLIFDPCYGCAGPKASINALDDYKLKAKTLQMLGELRRKPALGKAYGTSILRTSHQVRQEAAAILYAENSFNFVNPAAFSFFCEKIGSLGRFLRNVEIKGIDADNVTHKSMLEALRPARGLERLHLYIPDGKTYSQSALFKMIEALVTKLGTDGCRCNATGKAKCFCRTTEQQQAFDAIAFTVNMGRGQLHKTDMRDAVLGEWDTLASKVERSRKSTAKAARTVSEG